MGAVAAGMNNPLGDALVVEMEDLFAKVEVFDKGRSACAEAAGLNAFVKTSGGKGLHVCAPLRPSARWPAAKAFCKAIADAMAKDSPDQYVSTITKSKRRGKILIDYLRNQRGMTAVAPYSTRARPGTAVSMPLAVLQRHASQVVTVEMEKVEDIEGEAVVASRAEIGLEGGKIGCAGPGLHHELAVDQRRADRQGSKGGDHGLAELLRPVQSAAGKQLHPPGLDARLQPVAVELDLVQPAIAGRRRGGERRQRRWQEIGQLALAHALEAGGTGRFRFLRFRCLLCFRGFADASCLRGQAGFLPGDVSNLSAGLDRFRPFAEQVVLAFRDGERVVALDQQPVLALFAGLSVRFTPEEIGELNASVAAIEVRGQRLPDAVLAFSNVESAREEVEKRPQ